MADVASVLVAVARGDFDEHLGELAEALALRQVSLSEQQFAALALAAYIDHTGLSLDNLVRTEE